METEYEKTETGGYVRRSRINSPTPYSGLGKLPPQATDLEEAVLGGIMIEKEAILSVVEFLRAECFYKDNHQRIFTACHSLFTKGDPIDLLTIKSQLSKQGELEMIGGAYFLTELTERVSSAANIEYHARIVYQKWLQREMIRINTESIQSAYEDTTDVLELIESNQSSLFKLSTYETGKQGKLISNLLDDAIKHLDIPSAGNLTGVGTGFVCLDDFTAGWQKSEFTILAARPAMGKAQPLNSGVLTPAGFIKIGDLKIGDSICNSSGGTQKVTGVFPQGVKQTYTVKFNDDTETRCCDEHLWLTHSRYERKHKLDPSVKTLKEIRESLTIGSDNRKNHSIDFVSPVFFSKKELLIAPYLMGVLLGGGCLSHLSIVNPEFDIIERVSTILPNGCVIKRKKSNLRCPEYRINGVGRNNPMFNLLKKYGLENTLSPDKIIPPEYLRNSFENRLELLRGLLDTDGYVVDRHCIEFSTTSNWIRIGIIDLVRSLGGRATFKEKQGKYTKNGETIICKRFYRINISFTTNDFIPVTSNKHRERYQFSKNNLQKFITHVIPDKEDECVCISVSDPDKLYITDGYILTHNTALMMQLARNASVVHGVPTAVFSLEMSERQLANRMISNETEIFLEKINKKTLTDYDRQSLDGKLYQLRNAPLHVDDTPAITINQFRAKCIRLKRLFNIGFVVIDYLQLMRGDVNQKGNRDQEIGQITRGIKSVAKELDIPIIALSQLNRGVEDRPGSVKRPRLSDLRESGNIEQDADNVYFLFRPEYYGITSDENNNSTAQMAELICAKNRNGPTQTLYLKFRGAVMRFENWVNPAAAQIVAQFTPINEKDDFPNNFIIKPTSLFDEDPF